MDYSWLISVASQDSVAGAFSRLPSLIPILLPPLLHAGKLDFSSGTLTLPLNIPFQHIHDAYTFASINTLFPILDKL